jgi:ABC-2 type transport system permease protein
MHPELAAGVIHDIGYRRYDGPRLGRWQSARAVYVQSLRGVYGLGRPARAKVVPWLLFGIMCAPAAVSAALTAVVAAIPPIPYINYPYYLQLAIMVFLAAQAPQIVTGDVRFRVLSLYFSRPLERADYVWAKLAALATGLFVLIATPLLVIYAVLLLSHTHALGDATRETGLLLVGLAGAALHAVLLAAIGMAISAFTRVRAFAVVGIIGVYLVTSAVSSIVGGIAHGTDLGAAFEMLTPFSLLDGLQAWAFHVRAAVPLAGTQAHEGLGGAGRLGWLYAVVAASSLAGGVAILHWRYRRSES